MVNVMVRKAVGMQNYTEHKILTFCICSTVKIPLFKLGKTSLLTLIARSAACIAQKKPQKMEMMLNVLNKMRQSH